MQKEIPVVFAVDNNYVPYLGVALASLIAHADDQNTYSVFVLHTKLTDRNKKRLEAFSTKNVFVQCKDVSKEMKDFNIITINYITEETAYRLLIAELFPQYEKVVYLDSDIIILKDIAQLHDIDLQSNVVGAVRHIVDEYLKNFLADFDEIVQKEDYFNAGILIIDTKRFADAKIKENSFSLFNNNTKYPHLDQDALNITCQGMVCFIDDRWNHCCQIHILQPILRDKEIFEKNALDPWILHYASDFKPWKYPDMQFADYFWQYARNTPFYEEIIYKNTKEQTVIKHNSYLLPYESIPFGSSIALYGAGVVGSIFCQQIKLTGLYKLVAWFDKDYDKFRDAMLEVLPPKALLHTSFEYILIAVKKQQIAEEIKQELIEMGIERSKIIWTDPRAEIKWEMWTQNKKGEW